MNCQCHGLSKGFENACTTTVGKQGIGQNNIVQAKHVYIKLTKTLHEYGEAYIAHTVHSIVMDKLATSSSWQEGASNSNKIAFENM
jgi:hypothetical protein